MQVTVAALVFVVGTVIVSFVLHSVMTTTKRLLCLVFGRDHNVSIPTYSNGLSGINCFRNHCSLQSVRIFAQKR